MITSSTIAVGDRLGAQLGKLALLYFFGEKFNQKIVFYPELRDFGRTYQFLDYFDIPIEILEKRLTNQQVENYKKNTKILPEDPNYYSLFSETENTYLKSVQEVYSEFIIIKNGRNHIHYDAAAVNPEQDKHYDILSGFGTYQDWKTVQDKICRDFKFKEAVHASAQNKYKQIQTNTKQTVSIHFRRGDYISLASLNLKLGYYKKALKMFSPKYYKLVIFSDEIEYCKTLKFFSKYDVTYISGNNPGEDMCLMSLCDHHIIANSTFSFWGAFLNNKSNKIVICPEKFIGKKDKVNSYVNGNYYPKTWIPIKISEFYIIQYICNYFRKNIQRSLKLVSGIKRKVSKILCLHKK